MEEFSPMAKIRFMPVPSKQTLLFPSRLDEDIAADAPVRIIDQVLDKINIDGILKLYHAEGRNPFQPRMMLKIIVYAYMNNVYSCRRIEELLKRDIHFIWLAGYNKPDFITINRFRNRVKDEISSVFTQLVLLLAEKGFVSLEVEYVDGTKIESKANKYTFVWRKNVERNISRLKSQLSVLLSQINDSIAQENVSGRESVEITPDMVREITARLNEELSGEDSSEKKAKRAFRQRKKQIREIEKKAESLAAYEKKKEILGGRNSFSKTDPDATFMRMKEDAMNNGQTKPGYNLQIGTQNQFILDFALYPNPTDTLTYIPFMQSFAGRNGRLPWKEIADSGYGSEENYRYMEENGVEAFVKYNMFHKEQRMHYTPDPFQQDNFFLLLSAKTFFEQKIRAGFLAWNSALLVTFVSC